MNRFVRWSQHLLTAGYYVSAVAIIVPYGIWVFLFETGSFSGLSGFPNAILGPFGVFRE